MKNLEWYSRGKLLLTGEYFVLKGALCLSLPLKLGQKMTVETFHDHQGKIYWYSYYMNELWFQAVYNCVTFEIIETSTFEKAQFVQNLLLQAVRLNPKNVIQTSSIKIVNELEFDPNWGMGSSSTLISNLSFWFDIDPYTLLKNTTGGSGYDIACARNHEPILYSINKGSPKITIIPYKPSFREFIFFIYLGKKVNSAESISKNLLKLEQQNHLLADISEITNKIVTAHSIEYFEELVTAHEKIISEALNMVPVQKQFFADFPGTIKALGAWGGDFVMVTSTRGRAFVEKYFLNKGLTIIFNYNDLIL